MEYFPGKLKNAIKYDKPRDVQPDSTIDDFNNFIMRTVPEFYTQYVANNHNKLFIIEECTSEWIEVNERHHYVNKCTNYVVAKIIDNSEDSSLTLICTDQEGYNNIMDSNSNSHPIYAIRNITLKYDYNTQIKFGTIGTIFDKGFIQKVKDNLFPIYDGPKISQRPRATSRIRTNRKNPEEENKNNQTLIQKPTSSDLIKTYGSRAAAVVAIIAAAVYYMSSSQNGGGEVFKPESYLSYLSNLSEEEREALLNEIKPGVKQEELNAEISKLPESEQKAVKEEASKYFPGFTFDEDNQTIFGSLKANFGIEGGKRKRTNKKRKTNKRRNNKKKSNRHK